MILSDNQFIGKQQLHQGKGAYFWDSPEANLAMAAKARGKNLHERGKSSPQLTLPAPRLRPRPRSRFFSGTRLNLELRTSNLEPPPEPPRSRPRLFAFLSYIPLLILPESRSRLTTHDPVLLSFISYPFFRAPDPVVFSPTKLLPETAKIHKVGQVY